MRNTISLSLLSDVIKDIFVEIKYSYFHVCFFSYTLCVRKKKHFLKILTMNEWMNEWMNECGNLNIINYSLIIHENRLQKRLNVEYLLTNWHATQTNQYEYQFECGNLNIINISLIIHEIKIIVCGISLYLVAYLS